MKIPKTFTIRIVIQARTRAAAEALRQEIVGAVEDNAESGEIAADAFVEELKEEKE